MSDTKQSSDANALDANEVAAQAAALAKHLQSYGVAFLPIADEAAVNQWAARMRVDEPVAAVARQPTPQEAPSAPRQPPTAASTRRAPRESAPSLLAEVAETYAGDSLSAADRTARLEVLQQQVAACTRCAPLVQCRTMTVFGEGSVTPRVAFFGEGPGADEDRTGRPFVGKAGQLLTKMIEACKMQREEVYILNTVKCRPPGNRNPEPDEVSNCREYFEQQLEILRPEYIVCLGAVASQALLKSKSPVGRLRGTFHKYFESKVLVTYHPAYLLRNPSAKKAAWQDLQLMLRDAGLL